MLVLALDTTTRHGSTALLRHGTLLDCEIGDAARTHGERLPGDIMRLLERHGVTLRQIDLFAVAAGPGSLTGLRIGIATMQGLALANSRRLAGVSTLDALNVSTKRGLPPPYVAVWLDARRGEVFSALYRGDALIDGPSVDKPGDALARWARTVNPNDEITFAGDGALAYASVIRSMLPDAAIVPSVPPLAPAVAQLGAVSAAGSETLAPDAIRPIYVRRPDVELARDRRAADPQSSGEPRTQHPAPPRSHDLDH